MSGEDYSRICVGGLPVGVIGLKAAIADPNVCVGTSCPDNGDNS